MPEMDSRELIAAWCRMPPREATVALATHLVNIRVLVGDEAFLNLALAAMATVIPALAQPT